MNTSIFLAFVSLVCFGFVTFFQQVAGKNQVYSPSYMIVASSCVVLFAIVMHIVQKHSFTLSRGMTSLALIGGILGAVGVLALLLAFKAGGQGSIIFPISGMCVIMSAILSIIVYREPVTTTKILGLGLGVSSIIILSR